jgi:hypothetical protein
MRLLAAAFAGVAVLLWLVWVWFGIPEASVWQLLGSLSLAIVIIGGTAWVLACVLGGGLWMPGLWRRTAAIVVFLLVLCGISLWLTQYDGAAAEWLAVRISRARGRAINPRHLSWILPALRWGVFAVLAFAAVAPRRRILRNWRYWVLALALVIAGGYLPWKLLTWVPAFRGLPAQAISMAIRFVLAYTISVAALVAFGALLRRLPADPSPAS